MLENVTLLSLCAWLSSKIQCYLGVIGVVEVVLVLRGCAFKGSGLVWGSRRCTWV